MTYYWAPAARQLARQFAPGFPRKGSRDGWVGDTAHQARESDHNPDYDAGGVVRAVDIDVRGRDGVAIVAAAIADPRTRYVIHKARIWQNPAVYARGGWQTYNAGGASWFDPHELHVHVSIRHGKGWENDAAPWGKPKPVPSKPDPNLKGNAMLIIFNRVKGDHQEGSAALVFPGDKPAAAYYFTTEVPSGIPTFTVVDARVLARFRQIVTGL